MSLTNHSPPACMFLLASFLHTMEECDVTLFTVPIPRSPVKHCILHCFGVRALLRPLARISEVAINDGLSPFLSRV
jgi:hypothetical protein